MNAVRLSSAAVLLNKVLAEDPQNTLARRDLGMHLQGRLSTCGGLATRPGAD
jgi:hypothetical protein